MCLWHISTVIVPPLAPGMAAVGDGVGLGLVLPVVVPPSSLSEVLSVEEVTELEPGRSTCHKYRQARVGGVVNQHGGN